VTPISDAFVALLAYFRRAVLTGTRVASATIGTVCLLLLKVAGPVLRSIRRLWFYIASLSGGGRVRLSLCCRRGHALSAGYRHQSGIPRPAWPGRERTGAATSGADSPCTSGRVSGAREILAHPRRILVKIDVTAAGLNVRFMVTNRRGLAADVIASCDDRGTLENWIDRLVHHCHLVTIRGNSYRMRQHTDLWQTLRAPPDPVARQVSY
jgi:hypothetical protein